MRHNTVHLSPPLSLSHTHSLSLSLCVSVSVSLICPYLSLSLGLQGWKPFPSLNIRFSSAKIYIHTERSSGINHTLLGVWDLFTALYTTFYCANGQFFYFADPVNFSDMKTAIFLFLALQSNFVILWSSIFLSLSLSLSIYIYIYLTNYMFLFLSIYLFFRLF